MPPKRQNKNHVPNLETHFPQALSAESSSEANSSQLSLAGSSDSPVGMADLSKNISTNKINPIKILWFSLFILGTYSLFTWNTSSNSEELDESDQNPMRRVYAKTADFVFSVLTIVWEELPYANFFQKIFPRNPEPVFQTVKPTLDLMTDETLKLSRQLIRMTLEREPIEMLLLKIEEGADIQVLFGNIKVIMQIWGQSLQNNNFKIVKLMLEKGFHKILGSEDRLKTLNFVLDNLVVPEQIEILQLLFDFGFDINAQDNEGITPLHRAASLNQTNSLAWLIRHQADLNVLDYNGNSPIHAALKGGHYPSLEALLEGGASPNSSEQLFSAEKPVHYYFIQQKSPLEIAVKLAVKNKDKYKPFVEVLLKYGAKPSAFALWIAEEDPEILILLKQKENTQQPHVALGQGSLKSEEFLFAQEHYRKAIFFSPYDHILLTDYGRLIMERKLKKEHTEGDLIEAINCFQRATALGYTKAEKLLNEAESKLKVIQKKKKFEEGRSYFKWYGGICMLAANIVTTRIEIQLSMPDFFSTVIMGVGAVVNCYYLYPENSETIILGLAGVTIGKMLEKYWFDNTLAEMGGIACSYPLLRFWLDTPVLLIYLDALMIPFLTSSLSVLVSRFLKNNSPKITPLIEISDSQPSAEVDFQAICDRLTELTQEILEGKWSFKRTKKTTASVQISLSKTSAAREKYPDNDLFKEVILTTLLNFVGREISSDKNNIIINNADCLATVTFPTAEDFNKTVSEKYKNLALDKRLRIIKTDLEDYKNKIARIEKEFWDFKDQINGYKSASLNDVKHPHNTRGKLKEAMDKLCSVNDKIKFDSEELKKLTKSPFDTAKSKISSLLKDLNTSQSFTIETVKKFETDSSAIKKEFDSQNNTWKALDDAKARCNTALSVKGWKKNQPDVEHFNENQVPAHHQEDAVPPVDPAAGVGLPQLQDDPDVASDDDQQNPAEPTGNIYLEVLGDDEEVPAPIPRAIVPAVQVPVTNSHAPEVRIPFLGNEQRPKIILAIVEGEKIIAIKTNLQHDDLLERYNFLYHMLLFFRYLSEANISRDILENIKDAFMHGHYRIEEAVLDIFSGWIETFLRVHLKELLSNESFPRAVVNYEAFVKELSAAYSCKQICATLLEERNCANYLTVLSELLIHLKTWKDRNPDESTEDDCLTMIIVAIGECRQQLGKIIKNSNVIAERYFAKNILSLLDSNQQIKKFLDTAMRIREIASHENVEEIKDRVNDIYYLFENSFFESIQMYLKPFMLELEQELTKPLEEQDLNAPLTISSESSASSEQKLMGMNRFSLFASLNPQKLQELQESYTLDELEQFQQAANDGDEICESFLSQIFSIS